MNVRMITVVLNTKAHQVTKKTNGNYQDFFLLSGAVVNLDLL